MWLTCSAESSSTSNVRLSRIVSTDCSSLAAAFRCCQGLAAPLRISSPVRNRLAPYMLRMSGFTAASAWTSCMWATVRVFFSLNATLVRWHTSWMTSCDAYFHFSVSTSAWMQAAAPAATGSNFPANCDGKPHLQTYWPTLHNVISAVFLSAIDLIYTFRTLKPSSHGQ